MKSDWKLCGSKLDRTQNGPVLEVTNMGTVKLFRLLPYLHGISKTFRTKNLSKTLSTRKWVCANVFECARMFFGCNRSISNLRVCLRSVKLFRVCAQCCHSLIPSCFQQVVLSTHALSFFSCQRAFFLMYNFLSRSSNQTNAILELSNARLSALGLIILSC